jgi:DNA-binding HxlR family transcriptional regulator
LEIFGDRWSLLILRDMVLRGKQRYGELLDSAEAISTNILADRLLRLEEAGLISRSVDEQRQVLYAPTKKGRDLQPVLREIIRWGLKYDPRARVPAT